MITLAPATDATSSLEAPSAQSATRILSSPLPISPPRATGAGVQAGPRSITLREPTSHRAFPREYDFLLGRLSPGNLEEATRHAARLALPLHEVVVAEGYLEAEAYAAALALEVGLPMLMAAEVEHMHPVEAEVSRGGASLPCRCNGERWLLLDCLGASPGKLGELAGRADESLHVALATPAQLRACLVARWQSLLVDEAADGLALKDPSLSARAGSWLWQSVAVASVVGLVIGGIVVATGPALDALVTTLALVFLLIASLRAAILLSYALAGRGSRAQAQPVSDAELPVYTVLVPLFREGRVLPDLVRALRRLDYPRAKLDIKIILESVDLETQAVAATLDLGPPFEVVVVPDRQPRTKPKALNYALQFARGSYLVIYDAEDIPDPTQLQEALACFRQGPPSLACVQGRLMIDNTGAGWLCRQFSLEYLTLFAGLLPGLQGLRLPIPLGGTSNHFPTSVLRDLGGWDAYNVTEDADLGMRLARRGYRCAMIKGTTCEEAPHHLWIWMKQRTRWLKGWMQTYIVHMRRPARLLRDLGIAGFLSFQALIGGMVLSTLVYPAFIALLVVQLMTGRPFDQPDGVLGRLLIGVSLYNLAAGYGSSLLLSLSCVLRHRRWDLLLQLPLMPIYWLLISLAGYRALLQLATDPFKWEKTEHGLSRRSGT